MCRVLVYGSSVGAGVGGVGPEYQNMSYPPSAARHPDYQNMSYPPSAARHPEYQNMSYPPSAARLPENQNLSYPQANYMNSTPQVPEQEQTYETLKPGHGTTASPAPQFSSPVATSKPRVVGGGLLYADLVFRLADSLLEGDQSATAVAAAGPPPAAEEPVNFARLDFNVMAALHKTKEERDEERRQRLEEEAREEESRKKEEERKLAKKKKKQKKRNGQNRQQKCSSPFPSSRPQKWPYID